MVPEFMGDRELGMLDDLARLTTICGVPSIT